MDELSRRVMAVKGVVEFRHHHEVALDREGGTVCQTRAVAVFAAGAGVAAARVSELVVGNEACDLGFTRSWAAWADSDGHGRPLVEVHITDVEVPREACGTQAA